MKKTLILISAIALSISVFGAANPDKATTCSKDAVVKDACCGKDAAECTAEQKAACKLDQAACDAKQAACTLKTDAEKAACDTKTDAEKAACVKEAAVKKTSCGGCPLSK